MRYNIAIIEENIFKNILAAHPVSEREDGLGKGVFLAPAQ